MKRLNLSDTWKYCLQMHKWVAKEYEKGIDSVGELKAKWLEKHGLSENALANNCFFCRYAYARWQINKRTSAICDNCPAKKVERNFSCGNKKYDYWEKPVKFYKEMVRLNKLRLAKRKRIKK